MFIESTAEGVGGDFYNMSNRAQEITSSGLELSLQDYKFHFYAWWQDPKYSAKIPASGLRLTREKAAYFTAVEKAMNITLTDEQKQWYVNKETEQREEMKQEFPSTPQEAFLTSGRRVFNAESTLLAEAGCIPPLIVYDIEPVTGNKTKAQALRRGKKDELQRTLMNYLLVWELPDPDEQYAIGADPAEGLEHGDRSSLDVVKQSTGEQVAHWFGHLDAELFAHLLAHVGRLYNTAFIGPERNNHGHAVILKLREIYPPRFIYNEQHIDQDNDDDTPRLGWLTTRQSKPILTEGMKTLLNNGISGIRWTGTLSEMNTYVYNAKGSMNAQEGCFDDQVMSYCIAQEMRARMPVRVKPQPTERLVPWLERLRGKHHERDYILGEFRSQVQMSKQGGQQWQWLGHEQKWRNHDIRRTVATWLNEAGVNTWVVEHLLGHAVAGVAGIYNRAQYLDEKEKALNVWLDCLLAFSKGVLRLPDEKKV
ncbi:tyrosine-type recombinase/integrase [Salmonella enterica]|nr:tyrosine-type recombinase/integrase [Salmonella enterica]